MCLKAYLYIFSCVLLFSCKKIAEKKEDTVEFIYSDAGVEKKTIKYKKALKPYDKQLVELSYVTNEKGFSFNVVIDTVTDKIVYLEDDYVQNKSRNFKYKGKNYVVSFGFGNCGGTDCDFRIVYCNECDVLYKEHIGWGDKALMYDSKDTLCKGLLSIILFEELVHKEERYPEPPIIDVN